MWLSAEANQRDDGIKVMPWHSSLPNDGAGSYLDGARSTTKMLGQKIQTKSPKSRLQRT
jgi:hypothetical protein